MSFNGIITLVDLMLLSYRGAQTHRRQHTGERPYSCLECQHHFTNWPNYNKHMKRRHGINTSHTKHLANNQQLQQQQQPQTEQTQQPQVQMQQQSSAEDSLSVAQTESTTVQVNKSLVAPFVISCYSYPISVIV